MPCHSPPARVHNVVGMKRTTSEARAAASRANGSKSRGPVTARGKYNSSLNAFRHGALASGLVLPGENPQMFQDLYDGFMEEHQPRTPTERALVEDMVVAWWRKQRVWGLESARIQHQAKLTAQMGRGASATDGATIYAVSMGDLADNSKSLDLFMRYEARFERQFHRALTRLLDLQSRYPEPDEDSPDADTPNSQIAPENTKEPQNQLKTQDRAAQPAPSAAQNAAHYHHPATPNPAPSPDPRPATTPAPPAPPLPGGQKQAA